MKNLGTILLGSVAGLVLIGAAQAADLPTKKGPLAPPPANCYASFWTWLDSTAADCPLSYMGITVYGTIDMGAGYETHATAFNKDFPTGVNEAVNKQSQGAAWQWVPNGLAQSNVGIKMKEQVAPNWYIIGDVNAGFDPYSMQFSNGPRSVVDNNTTAQIHQTANGDSSRTWGWDNTRAYAGIQNSTFGTLTFGRQYSFVNDLVGNYDPTGGAYAFSLMGNSGTLWAGTGDTETARYSTSAKYTVAYNGFRAGGQVQFGGLANGNGAQSSWQAGVGGDFNGFSVDAVYTYAQDAVVLGAWGTSSAPPTPADTLKATLADISAVVLAAKYKWSQFTVYGAYEHAELSNPTDPWATAAQAGGWTNNLNGGYPAVIQKSAYYANKDLQLLWAAAKYSILPNLDLDATYAYAWQNNYSVIGKTTFSGSTTSCVGNTVGVGTYAPQGASSSQCAGSTEMVGGVIDWRPVKRLDVYAGVSYSLVAGGMANGYMVNNDTSFTTGLKLAF